MREGRIIQIKSCVWHNLLKANFTPHIIIMVFWDSRTSASQNKIIYSIKNEHTRSYSANYSMSLSLSLTQNELLNVSFYLFDTKWNAPNILTLRVFSKKLFLWMRDYEKLYVIEQALYFNVVHRLTDSKIKIIKYYYLDK